MECLATDGSRVVLAGTFSRFELGRMVTCIVSEEASPDNPHCLVLTVHPEGDGTKLELLHLAIGGPYDPLQMEGLWRSALARLASLFGRVTASGELS